MAEYSHSVDAVTLLVPTVIGLGRLVDLILRDANDQRHRLTPHGERWLAWKPDTSDLVVLKPGRGRSTLADRNSVRQHLKFHGAAPQQARPMEWPTPRGSMRTLGRIESVTYTATDIRSPSKGLHHWIHHFGDRGKQGHGPASPNEFSTYTKRFHPRLDADEGGNLFITRLAGNRYVVRDWIIG